MDVSWIRPELADMLESRQFVTDKSGVRMLELTGASFLASEDVIFGEVNHDWAKREIAWYESRSRNVYDIEPPIPEIWKKVADEDGIINSNYGWCVYSEENGFQYDFVLDELSVNPWSRRAVMIYTRPQMHVDFGAGGRSDFICTNAVQYLIRDGMLHAVVQMRSSDLIFGYKGDRHWQEHVLRKLATELEIPAGTITWQAGSAHVYERHFYLVDHWSKTGELTIKKAHYKELYTDSEWAR